MTTYLKRANKSPATGEDNTRQIVQTMLREIEQGGEERVREYARELDGWDRDTVVSREDFDATARLIEEAGGQVALPKYALEGMAWQGYFLDSEGNTFGIHQPDENAK